MIEYIEKYKNLSIKQKLLANVLAMAFATIILTALLGGWHGLKILFAILILSTIVGGFMLWLMYLGGLMEKL